MGASRIAVSVCLLIAGLVGDPAVAVNIETVPVGDPGNVADTGHATDGYGSVGYTYNIGKYEVTAGQYTEFLNSVAKTDTYALYSNLMAYEAPGYYGCNIERTGSSGNFTYSVAADWANRPVNWVSWGNAARFCNWLTNGQPSGAQNSLTTEDGSYYLNGATTDGDLLALTRKVNARWVIPSEDEWYKAAYYDLSKPGGAGYWDYPTRTNTMPSNVLSTTGTNNANYYDENRIGNSTWTIGSPYYRTEVGTFDSSPSAYGTFDQGGNVWEWNEALIDVRNRGVRGGSFDYSYAYESGYGYYMHAASRVASNPTSTNQNFGFRVAYVPEPATLSLFIIGASAILRRRRPEAQCPRSAGCGHP